MNKVLLALLVSAMPLLSNANTLVFNPTTAISFTGYDSIAATGAVSTGSFGSFSTVGTGNGTLTATFLGKEAGFTNFYFDADNLLGASGGSVSTVINGAGLVNFGFKTSNGSGGYTGIFKNGMSSTAVLGFAVLNVLPGHGDYDFFVGFNDIYPGDADYDDLVVGLKYATTVPVPASLPLMVSALGLFGFGVSRKRTQK